MHFYEHECVTFRFDRWWSFEGLFVTHTSFSDPGINVTNESIFFPLLELSLTWTSTSTHESYTMEPSPHHKKMIILLNVTIKKV